MGMPKKILFLINNIEAIFAGICFCIIVILINQEVVLRYVFHNPGSFTEEFVRYMFIYCIFLSIPYALKENAHIVTDIIPQSWPRNIHLFFNLFSTAVFFIFSLFMIWIGNDYVSNLVRFERPTEAMGVPMWWFAMAVPLGFVITAIRAVQRFVAILRSYNAESQNSVEHQ